MAFYESTGEINIGTFKLKVPPGLTGKTQEVADGRLSITN